MMIRKTHIQILSVLFLCFIAGTALGQIGFNPASSLAVGDQPDAAAISDLNGDGLADIAVTSDNQDKVSVLFNQGGGSFDAPVHTLLAGGSGPQYVLAGDFNNNGIRDLAISLKNTNTVQVWTNNGSGSLSLGSTTGVGTEPRNMAMGFLDQNGSLDLVVINRGSNNVSVLINNGSGAFTATTYATGLDPRGVTLGDFDGNGSLDIAVSAHDDREINILSNSGTGTFTSTVNLFVGAQLRPEGLTAADLDCNGSADIAAATSGNGLNFSSVFLSIGANTFSGPTNFAVGGVDPSDIVASDFDLDGDPDLATVNTTSNNVSVLAGNGLGSFGASSEFSVGTAPGHIAAGDLDGNGSKELVTANKDSDDVSVLVNQNSGWLDLGFNLAGTYGEPVLEGTGALAAGEPVSLMLTNALENTPALFAAGLSRIDAPFMGGTFVPSLDLLFVVPTSPSGTLNFNVVWPETGLKGVDLYFQIWVQDGNAIGGLAASNALQTITQ